MQVGWVLGMHFFDNGPIVHLNWEPPCYPRLGKMARSTHDRGRNFALQQNIRDISVKELLYQGSIMSTVELAFTPFNKHYSDVG